MALKNRKIILYDPTFEELYTGFTTVHLTPYLSKIEKAIVIRDQFRQFITMYLLHKSQINFCRKPGIEKY